MMRRYALGDGLSGVLMSLIAERARRQPDHSDRRIAVIGHKLQRIFAVLEAEAPALAGGAFDMGQIAVVAALAYLDFRLPDEGVWRARHPALARWFETAGARPSVAATAYFDDLAASRSSPPQQQGGPSR
jgi:glutathione S-transferase